MKYLSVFLMVGLGLTACQQDDLWEAELPLASSSEAMASIRFVLAAEPGEDTRNTYADGIEMEESNVSSLVYAIFQDKVCRVIREVDLGQSSSYQAGGLKNYYTIQDVPKKYLDATTEIYAVANPPLPLKNDLLNGTYQIPDNEPLLQKMVAERIDSLAKAQTYDYLVDRVYNNGGGRIPWDGKFYIDLTNKNHYINGTIDGKYRCSTYAEFVSRLNDVTLPAEDQAVYQRMWLDLQCRFVLIQNNVNIYHSKKNDLTNRENQDHVILRSFQADKNLQRYWLWRHKEWEKDLNQEAATNLSKWIEQPVMAGFHKLSEDFSTTIVVPVERVYSRIWFDFQWDAHKETEAITIDSIVVRGLMTKTKLFNLNKEQIDNNPAEFTKVTSSLINPGTATSSVDATMQPFFANLQTLPHHVGEKPQMLLHADYPSYHTLAVYEQTADLQINVTKPHRCYVYSFQWGGNSLQDDPEIVVSYHFKKRSQVAGEVEDLVYKKAKARLYDETHYPGKLHHGLLRNYTYQLNCKVTSLSHTLDVQVVAVPWYKISIDDIPSFE